MKLFISSLGLCLSNMNTTPLRDACLIEKRSALKEKYNSNTKEARRAYQKKIHNTKTKSGDDPDDLCTP